MSLPSDPRSVWLTSVPAPGARREAKHRLSAATKRLIEAVCLLDVDDPGTAMDNVESVISAIDAANDQLASNPSLRARGGMAASGGDDAILAERSGITGRSNPLAPPLHLELHGATTRGWALYGASYEGPPDTVHGGFVAAAFDDLLGVAQMASGTAGFTGTLTVKMRRPTPLYRRIDYEAGVTRAEGRKIWCYGRSFDGNVLLAEAEILFISPRVAIIPRESH